MKPLIEDKTNGGAQLADEALKNLFRVQFRLGLADPPSLVPWSGFGAEVVDTEAHRSLAKEAADQSLVLLKNDGALPFKAGLKVLVAGRNAAATGNMQGNYYGQAPFLVSPKDGIAKRASVTYLDGKDVSQAVQAVADVDAVVLVVGLTSEAVSPNDEAEGHDRNSLRLPNTDGDQEALIQQVGAAAGGKPVVVVVMSGGPVDIQFAKESDAVSAIMWCGYPGQSGGDAISDALFGITNAFGKLTQTWYPEAFVSQVDLKDMGMRPNATTGNPGRSYRFYTGPTVFSFGDGLSYTNFEHDVQVMPLLGVTEAVQDLQRRPLRTEAKVVARARVAVTNMGTREGDAAVMLFAAPPSDVAGKNGAPLKSLMAFDRVKLAAGESTSLTFSLSSLDFSFAGEDGVRKLGQGEWKFWVGSSDEQMQKTVSMHLSGDAEYV